MSERQEDMALPGLEKAEILEGLGPDALVDYILGLGEKVTQIERDMNLASDVLSGAYGLSVEQILQEREMEDTQSIDMSGLLFGETNNGETS